MRIAVLMGLIVSLLCSGPRGFAAEPLPNPTGPVLLTITGHIARTNAPGAARFDRAMLETLGSASIRTSSEVSQTPQLFEGVPLRALLERVGAEGKSMTARALNDYEAVIPLEDLRYEPILATKVDGQVLTARDKGPLWIVYPRDQHRALNDMRYDSRWVWQLNRLHIEAP
jgi:hypothetical protein